ncbi:hypothetical protein [Zobellia alginiliquefaciens]|uniref:YobI family P-loop NTPase n=1 Tax=Zobellia alginiliquefaciens TaxID=3032586 RepID=UPI0023E3F2B5|nr:hypothetical protein [Zobellia alginiliquefaciens]
MEKPIKNPSEVVKKFESLSPKQIDSESISIYLSSLKEGLDDMDVKNFALTGSYGSGKSSIIRSFQAKYKGHYNFLNISLAEFKWESNNSPQKFRENNENLDKLIELSILQQIFYKVKPIDVPDSRLKRIKNISNKEIIGVSIAIIFWLLSTFALISFNYVNSLNPSNWSTSYDPDWTALIFFFISLVGLYFLLKKVVRLLYNSRINKINVKGIELGKELDESILNKHLDEILYFFERTSFNVVIIEDLDRQDELNIFTKLREINGLINNSNQVISDTRRKVTFIYAVRDEILQEKDRTKFFDLVIPVIPFINNHNSNEKLREKLLDKSNSKLINPLTEEFIDDVSLFIDDMRLLTNICNEYTIYKEQLNKKLKQNNLLATIVYKNMRPLDFVSLHNKEGKIYSLLSRARKSEILKLVISTIENEQNCLKKEIEKIGNEKRTDIKEINAIYLNEIRKSVRHDLKAILIESEYISFQNLEQEPHFLKLDKSKKISYSYGSNFNASTNITFSDIENSLSSNLTYEERIQNIKDKENDVVSQKQYQIDLLEDKKNRTKALSIKSILKEYKSEDFLREEEKSDKLMLFFLRNGFIDENYYDYISYFHGVSLTPEDNEYLISVKSESPLGHDFRLKNIKTIIKRIQPRYFENKTILNQDLITFILKNKGTYTTQYNSIFNMLTRNQDASDESRELMGFINSYLKSYPLESKLLPKQNIGRTDIFLNEICKRWLNIWSFINSSSGLSKKDTTEILRYILSVVDDKIILGLNSEGYLANYISSQPDFLSIPFESYQQKFGNVIQKLTIKFKILNEPTEQTKKLFDFVYENNYYQLNDKNIVLMMNKYGLSKDKKVKERYNFTDIVSSQSKHLKNYVEKEINDYLRYTNSVKDAYIEENEESIIRIYNNKRLKEDIKFDFLKKETIQISDLSEINEERDYPSFFKHGKIVPNWNNVSLYFSLSENSIDDILIEFLNDTENHSTLSSDKIYAFKKNDDDLVEKLSVAIIIKEELTLATYAKLLKSIPRLYSRWKKIEFEKLSQEKVQELISLQFLGFSESNFSKIVKNYPKLLIKYLVIHQHTFSTKYDEKTYPLTISQKEEFFESSLISKEHKILVFEKLEKSEVISNVNLSEKIGDVLSLYGYAKLDFEYLKSFFLNSKSIENRIKLFNSNHHRLEDANSIKLIQLLPNPFKKISEKQKKPTINKSTTNIEFVEILKTKKLISSYKILDDKIRVVAKY